ncbi:MAG: hypothetical protein QM617_00595 [Comamonas sp.]
MAFDKNAVVVDAQRKSVLLMVVDISRSDGSRYAPEPIAVRFEKKGAQSKEERQNFRLEKEDAVTEDGRTVYLARMALEPGDYRLGDIAGMAKAFPFVGIFAVPLLMDFKVEPNSITYVGRVSAVLRPKQDGEFRAGPLLPLIDQGVTGMSGNTWDIRVEDRAEKDVVLFKENYRALSATAIQKTLLPPFDRLAVQRWWDGQEEAKE